MSLGRGGVIISMTPVGFEEWENQAKCLRTCLGRENVAVRGAALSSVLKEGAGVTCRKGKVTGWLQSSGVGEGNRCE